MEQPNLSVLSRAVARAYCTTLAEWFADDPAGLARIRAGDAEVSALADDAQLAVDAWETATGAEYVGSWDDDQPAHVRERAVLCTDTLAEGERLARRAAFDPAAFADAPERVALPQLPIPPATEPHVSAVARRYRDALGYCADSNDAMATALSDYMRRPQPVESEEPDAARAWEELWNAAFDAARPAK